MYNSWKIRPDFNCLLPECARTKYFFLWVGIPVCIEIVHTKFRDPRWKIMVSATLESWVLKNSFSAKKVNFAALSGAIIFHLGSWNFVWTMPKHIYNYCKKNYRIALLHSGRWHFQFEVWNEGAKLRRKKNCAQTEKYIYVFKKKSQI